MYAVPGGLIGIGLKVDPFLTRTDRLVGQIIGHKNNMPDVLIEIEVQYYLMRRLLGIKADKNAGEERSKVQKIKDGETLMINIGSTSLGGTIIYCNSVIYISLPLFRIFVESNSRTLSVLI